MKKIAQYIYDNYIQKDEVLGVSKVKNFFCYNICPSVSCEGKDRSARFKENINYLKNDQFDLLHPKFIEFFQLQLVTKKDLDCFENDFVFSDLEKYMHKNNINNLSLFDFILFLKK